MGGGGSSRSRVPQIDPQAMIRQNEQVNRVNTSGPFGSQTYTTDANGQRSLQTTLSPEMQGVISRAFGMAGQQSPRYRAPQGFGDLLSMYMQRVSSRAEGDKK